MNTIVGPSEVLFRQVSLYLDSCHLRPKVSHKNIRYSQVHIGKISPISSDNGIPYELTKCMISIVEFLKRWRKWHESKYSETCLNRTSVAWETLRLKSYILLIHMVYHCLNWLEIFFQYVLENIWCFCD
jgi:hypothetical protein